jgi:hypothetical protein
MALYFIPNGPSPTTASQVAVTTGTAIVTLLQVKLAATHTGVGRVVEWGISFDGAAAAAGLKCELLTTGTVAATITEHLAAGIVLYDANGVTTTDDNPFAFGAGGDETGYTASAEGTITASRVFDVQHVQPTNQYVKQFPLGREPTFKATEFLRVRVKAAAAVNAYCYVIVEV